VIPVERLIIEKPKDPAFDAAVNVCISLRDAGHEAYLVGGCVRDLVLGALKRELGGRPLDYDITTSATPDEVKRLFKKTVAVGVRFGVVKVLHGHYEFEVATFRGEAGYFDGRHPQKVWFSSLEEDLKRRDFTINTLVLDCRNYEILDYMGGLEDLRKGIIRAVGNPSERFKEDHLRMLRAVRFAGQLGFEIEQQTLKAIRESAPQISKVSKERVREEVFKLLQGRWPAKGISLGVETGLLYHAVPLLRQVSEGRLKGLGRCLPLMDSLVSKISLFLYDLGPIRARAVLRYLKASNRIQNTVEEILKIVERIKSFDTLRVAQRKRLIRKEFFPHAQKIIEACWSEVGIEKSVVNEFHDFLEHVDKGSLFPPRLINGDMLKKMGYRPGPLFKKALDAVEDGQLEGRVLTQEDAWRVVKEILGPPPSNQEETP